MEKKHGNAHKTCTTIIMQCNLILANQQ